MCLTMHLRIGMNTVPYHNSVYRGDNYHDSIKNNYTHKEENTKYQRTWRAE